MWLKEVEENAEKDCLIILVGNKMDLQDHRTVFVRDGISFARKNELAFIETSALDATGVETAFQRILQEIYKTQTKKLLKNAKGKTAGGSAAPLSHGQTLQLKPEEAPDESATKNGCC